jgi:hypothetical protein
MHIYKISIQVSLDPWDADCDEVASDIVCALSAEHQEREMPEIDMLAPDKNLRETARRPNS